VGVLNHNVRSVRLLKNRVNRPLPAYGGKQG
jgi:hypothetical protein